MSTAVQKQLKVLSKPIALAVGGLILAAATQFIISSSTSSTSSSTLSRKRSQASIEYNNPNSQKIPNDLKSTFTEKTIKEEDDELESWTVDQLNSWLIQVCQLNTNE